MAKEDTYRQMMMDLGVWKDAFAEEVKQLCILERELSRTMKAWKATAAKGQSPSVLDPHYKIISQLRADIFAHRECLGLTPKGLQRLKGAGGPNLGTETQGVNHALDKLEELVGGYELPEDCP